LDSFSAVQVCQVLKKVANAGASVLFTIHQPSSEIFRSFDHLILLHKGRVLYQGAVSSIPDYYAERGYPLPSNYNPADWVINVAQQYEPEVLERAGFFEPDYRENVYPEVRKKGEDFLGHKIRNRKKLSRDERVPSLMIQTRMLFSRELVHMYRYQLPQQARLFITIVLSTLIRTLFD
jgi:ABC-type multidrug transport system ATPase subunit